MDASSAPASDPRARRRKRTRFGVPDWKPRPVRALWESATDADRERAHRSAMVILEYWQARLSKQEAAEKLGVKPLRVWQLSQQAVSGILAGLLTQPRDRGAAKDAAGALEAQERRSRRERALERRVVQLERQLEESARLIEVMRELPVVRVARERRSGVASQPVKKGSGARKRGTANRGRGA